MKTASLILASSAIIIIAFSLLLFFYSYDPDEKRMLCKDCNFIIITIDSLRADHVSSYGYFQNTTPNIDNLASEGVLFENAFSQIPQTTPSHWSIFSGLFPFNHGKFLPSDNGTAAVTICDVLKDNGYTTSGFASSGLLAGFSGEFDYFNGYTDTKNRRNSITRRGEETTGDVLSWLGDHSKEKFFMWVHYFDPHSPYDPPEAWNGNTREEAAKYDGEIRYSDYNTGLVLEKVRELGLENQTVIILLSDHGECFGEHNFSEFGYEENGTCVFHGSTLYDEEIRIPLVIKNPQYGPKGIKMGEIVQTVDIFPTIMDIIGIKYNISTDGKSLAPLLENKGYPNEYAIIQTRPVGLAAAFGIRTKEWKFVGTTASKIDPEKDIEGQEGQDKNLTANESLLKAPEKLLFRIDDGESENFYNEREDIAQNLENVLLHDVPFYTFIIEKYEADKLLDFLTSLDYVV